MTIRLFVADDHKIVRDGLQQIIALASDIRVMHECSNGTELLALLAREEADLLLMDLSMPDGGVGLIATVRRGYPQLPILVLSMHNEAEVAAAALDAGANGYLTKSCDAETLLFAIRRIKIGEHFVDPSLSRAVMAGRNTANSPIKLSERENQILAMLTTGLATKEIARQLEISVKTVSTHKTNLMLKLDIDNNADLVRYALRAGLGSQ